MGNVASPRAKMPKMVTGNVVHKRTTSLVVDLDHKLPVGSDLLFSAGESSGRLVGQLGSRRCWLPQVGVIRPSLATGRLVND
ncbi:hypothetical protein QYF36_013989 [Acer negundo]|nr:hypothetical protein QYF36_013989 [Acer negundo]